MPKGPQGQKRKADVIGNAVLIGKIATGEAEDEIPKGKAASGRLGGLKGGKSRAEKLTQRELSRQGKNAAISRWSKKTV